MAWTRETLSSLRRLLEVRYESVPFWTAEEARLALNEGLAFWNLLTGYWKTRATLDAQGGDPFHVLPAAFVFGTRLAYQSQPLALGSLVGLFRGRPGWWTETTADGGDVPTRPMVWAPVSLQLIAIWPTPAVNVADALTIDGIAATPSLTTDASAVDLEDGVLDVLLGYALHAVTFKEGWARFAATSPQLHAFLALAGEQNGQLKASAMYRAYMGLDRTRDFRKTRGVPERLSPLLEAVGSPFGA